MPSTRFLFWNINSKPLADVVGDLVEAERADVVVLAECASPETMLQALNVGRRGGFYFPPAFSEEVAIFTRFAPEFLTRTFEGQRLSVWRLHLPRRPEVLLAAAHLPSKLYWSSESQAFECSELARQIATEEDRAGHRRTVLVGDFNMNPFEPGLVAAGGLHAIMSRRIAARLVRTVQGREYRFFYNPMWGHFGDTKSATAGSYFYDSAQHVNYYWNVFDQVLIRPELAEGFDASQLRILTSAGTRSLVRPDGRPDGARFSDHLPIIFELTF